MFFEIWRGVQRSAKKSHTQGCKQSVIGQMSGKFWVLTGESWAWLDTLTGYFCCKESKKLFSKFWPNMKQVYFFRFIPFLELILSRENVHVKLNYKHTTSAKRHTYVFICAFCSSVRKIFESDLVRITFDRKNIKIWVLVLLLIVCNYLQVLFQLLFDPRLKCSANCIQRTNSHVYLDAIAFKNSKNSKGLFTWRCTRLSI